MMFSRNVFCGATRPLRPPGILSPLDDPRLRSVGLSGPRPASGYHDHGLSSSPHPTLPLPLHLRLSFLSINRVPGAPRTLDDQHATRARTSLMSWLRDAAAASSILADLYRSADCSSHTRAPEETVLPRVDGTETVRRRCGDGTETIRKRYGDDTEALR